MQLISDKQIPIQSLNGYRFFDHLLEISDDKFKNWIKFLFKEIPNEGIYYVLNSFFYYYRVLIGDRQLPKKMTLKILRKPIYQRISQQLPDYNEKDQKYHKGFYKKIAKRLVEQYPESAEDLFEMIIEFYMNPSSYKSTFNYVFNDLLTYITQNYTDTVWKKIKKVFEEQNELKVSSILKWLRKDDRGLYNLELFKYQDIVNWINEDVENRAKLIISIIPTKNFNSEDKISRKILELFGNRDDVRKAFTDNFLKGRIYSIFEDINPYQVEKDWLLKIYENENSDNIKKWIIEFIENHLDYDIERSNKQKERKGCFGF